LKSTFLYIIILLCFTNVSAQQNLIPNPSFEEYWSCPIENELGQGEFNKCKHWWYPHPAHIGTPDYFNRCNNNVAPPNYSIVGVPNNFWGYQEAFDGDAYVGIGLLNVMAISKIPISTELISCKLHEPLKECILYRFTAKINLANKSTHSIRKIGFKLTTDSLKIGSISESINLIENWNNVTQLSDTIRWMSITAEITARGNEEYITIGYFHNYNENEWLYNDSVIINSTNTYASY